MTEPSFLSEPANPDEPTDGKWAYQLLQRKREEEYQPSAHELRRLLKSDPYRWPGRWSSHDLHDAIRNCPDPDLRLLELVVEDTDQAHVLARNPNLSPQVRAGLGRWAARQVAQKGDWAHPFDDILKTLAFQERGLPESVKRQLIQSFQSRRAKPNSPSPSLRSFLLEVSEQFSPDQLLEILAARPKWSEMGRRVAQHPDVEVEQLEQMPALGQEKEGTRYQLLKLATQNIKALESPELRKLLVQDPGGSLSVRLLGLYEGERARQMTEDLIEKRLERNSGGRQQAEEYVAHQITNLPVDYRHRLAPQALLPLLQSQKGEVRTLIMRELGHLLDNPDTSQQGRSR